MKTYQTFVKLDGYETEALKKLQKVLSAQEGRELSKQEVIRACVRYCVHDLMGRDFVLGRDAKSYLGDGG
jgi:hypothetical protein